MIEGIIPDKAYREALFERAPYGKAIVSPEGKILESNRFLCNFLGYSESELHSLSFLNFTDVRDKYADADEFSKLVNGDIDSYSMEKRFRSKSGATKWAQIYVIAIRDEDKRFVAAVGVLRPILEANAPIVLNNRDTKEEKKLNRVFETVQANIKSIGIVVLFALFAIIYLVWDLMPIILRGIKHFLTGE